MLANYPPCNIMLYYPAGNIHLKMFFQGTRYIYSKALVRPNLRIYRFNGQPLQDLDNKILLIYSVKVGSRSLITFRNDDILLRQSVRVVKKVVND